MFSRARQPSANGSGTARLANTWMTVGAVIGAVRLTFMPSTANSSSQRLFLYGYKSRDSWLLAPGAVFAGLENGFQPVVSDLLRLRRARPPGINSLTFRSSFAVPPAVLYVSSIFNTLRIKNKAILLWDSLALFDQDSLTAGRQHLADDIASTAYAAAGRTRISSRGRF